uniref:PPC domain-containing protein n=1 Tax=Leptocylindrus danicus TaxID=163516 RepID=A0A7S2NZA0_9STRA|mmetsp:Transcript_17969/g.26744  ORF Transcript_17969/g.26744 Transcript_17969/m.26744 type:complete len:158 (+) Transcript_17969:61-534(+)
MYSGNVRGHAFRMRPDDSLMQTLKQSAETIFEEPEQQQADGKSIAKSAFIMTAVGSLSSVTLRMANADANNKDNEIKVFPDTKFEIVSMTGTFAPGRKCHVHISLSDSTGAVIGGHLIEGTIYTTAEIVLGSIEGVSFDREMDKATGFMELVVRKSD